MKKNIIVPLFMLMLGASAQQDVSQAFLQTKTVSIDGISSEWQKPFNLYDGSTGLLFTISNDSTNLYFCFTANDETKARKMMRAGWAITLSSKEKNKKVNASIVFAKRQMMEGENKMNHEGNWHKHGSFTEIVNNYKLQLTAITASGFKTKNGTMPWINENGINIAVGVDSTDGIVYEVSIPLKELFDANVLQNNEQLSLNVEVNALEPPSSGSEYRGGGQGSGWGSGSAGGRMAGEENRAGNMNPNNPMNNNSMNNNPMNNSQRTDDFSDENETQHTTASNKSVLFEKGSLKQKFKLAKN